MFIFSNAPPTASGALRDCSKGTGALTPTVKSLGRESEHFLPSNSEPNAWSYIPRPDVATWPAEGLHLHLHSHFL
jgi:hypothetical protein